MTSEITMETLNYRLEQLEKSVSELKSLLVDTKIQDKDIKDLQKDCLNLDDKIDIQASRVTTLEKRIDNLEKAPALNKASWFDKTMDVVFKLAITAIAGLVFMKIGLSQ